ncbi:MAG: hypothetical protein HC802_10705, partial [Caldilineaceae bacterium]|nr:hypothetical protein [Caldilineaceae bacterium]
MCRLNNGFEPDGTIPHSSLYGEFAQRVANFVGGSRGCKIWIIGNEMNYAVERPGISVDWSRHASAQATVVEDADPLHRSLAVRFNVLPDHSTEIRTTRGAIVSPGETITPEMYARCYQLCREAIHSLPGRGDDQVLVGAVAPWNTQTIYPGNPNGDWVGYFRDILETLGAGNCDGFALHAYTQGSEPLAITEDRYLSPPFQGRRTGFRVFMDFMEAVPPKMRHLPAYITESDQTGPWIDVNTTWVQQAYAEIDAWNRQPGAQQIRSLILYRWPKMDKWYIEGKQGVIDDFRQALENDYRWRGRPTAKKTAAPPVAPKSTRPPSQPEATPLVEKAEPPEEDGQEAQPEPPAPEAEAPAPITLDRPDYRVQWVDDEFPSSLVTGQTVVASITLKNAGSLAWSWSGGNPFRLGYRFSATDAWSNRGRPSDPQRRANDVAPQ